MNILKSNPSSICWLYFSETKPKHLEWEELIIHQNSFKISQANELKQNISPCEFQILTSNTSSYSSLVSLFRIPKKMLPSNLSSFFHRIKYPALSHKISLNPWHPWCSEFASVSLYQSPLTSRQQICGAFLMLLFDYFQRFELGRFLMQHGLSSTRKSHSSFLFCNSVHFTHFLPFCPRAPRTQQIFLTYNRLQLLLFMFHMPQVGLIQKAFHGFWWDEIRTSSPSWLILRHFNLISIY